jgi:glycosyltransferase involved in cell wall biosynthesis
MTPPLRIAFIGNSLPRRCGIATFTSDLRQAVAAARPGTDATIVAMTDRAQSYAYPPAVRMQVHDQNLDDYVRAADGLNAAQLDAVSLQHEFGIFGGEAGAHLLTLLSRLSVPIVTTLHTVLPEPAPVQRRVLDEIVALSSKVVVMAEKGRELLRSTYAVPADKIEVIPHGIPDAPYADPEAAKTRLGFSDKSTILTFGLLSKNKGIEVMIDAMPGILQRKPDALYVVLGATHPNLVRDQGETYRDSLIARARALGIEKHVLFLDRFVDKPTLLEFISMCDVYVTPYLNESQMTSGTLAYSFGMGRPVVSTPYWHARELLADGRGVLVPFNDAAAIGTSIADLLTDDVRRERMRKRAYASSRSMTWERTAASYAAVFDGLRRSASVGIKAVSSEAKPLVTNPPPHVSLDHFELMCDDTGLIQHAVYSVPDRAHGYCVDDNARALLVACALNAPDESPVSESLCVRFAAFVQHAWNGDRKRFRNFMSFDRRWLEEVGSEDSHGRSLWALGECARSDSNPARRRWASSLFLEALPAAESFASPRAWSFTLLGLDAYIKAAALNPFVANLRLRLAQRLVSSLESAETRDWVWFEKSLTYENARMPQALIVTGVAAGEPSFVTAGLRSLRWLMTLQTTSTGCFRPVGSQGFGEHVRAPLPFDQQPVEASATISACRAAWSADADPRWRADALRTFSWFLGRNDLSIPLVDVADGSCCDGLHPDRANENRGAESVVSWLLALTEIRELYRVGNPAMKPKAIRETRPDVPVAPAAPTTH